MKVELITPEKYSDDFVVDCARISYDKRADQFSDAKNAGLIRYLNSPPGGVPHWSPFAGPRIGFDIPLSNSDFFDFLRCANLAGFSWKETSDKTVLLNGSLWAWKENLKFLPSNSDEGVDRNTAIKAALSRMFPKCASVFGWDVSPIDYFFIPSRGDDAATRYENLRIRAPIFVARQLVKHQVQLTWSEVSRRYVNDCPELFFPESYHFKPVDSKQGASSEIFPSDDDDLFLTIGNATEAVNLYNRLIAKEMAPEEARIFLPLCMMTEWIWTGSIKAFQRVCRERLAPTAQGPTREVAQMISDELAKKYGADWRDIK